jgi:hypothetical protein
MRRKIRGGTALLALSVFTSACTSPKPTPASPPASTAVWGDLTPVVSVKELMHDVIEPAADPLFKAVSITVDKQHGIQEEGPKTDADWEKIRIGAVTLAEAVSLLKVPRPIVPPGTENSKRDATELPPDQILAKLQKDPVLWNARIQTVRNVGLQALDVVKRKDAQELWDVAENLDSACETCHLDYWYPGQRALLKNVQERIRQATEQPAGR